MTCTPNHPNCLQTALNELNLPFQVEAVQEGPAVIRHILSYNPGIHLSALTKARMELMRALNVPTLSIVAPIPGTMNIAIDIPKKKVEVVHLADLLENAELRDSKTPLLFPLGLDVAGQPVLCDLAQMPHLLIGGVAGSGKTMLMRTMLASLMLRNAPESLQLIIADLAGGDLQIFSGVPHLQRPLITEAEQTLAALEWAVQEMMRRYACFQEAQVRKLDAYNAAATMPMPRIVIVVDGLHQLMRCHREAAEEAITRLAQLGRAAGMHLVLTIQNTSPEALSGLIKVNFPSRIAFRLPTSTDSRAMLDRSGAEELCYPGDMLYSAYSAFEAERVQGCCIAEDELRALVQSLKAAAPGDK